MSSPLPLRAQPVQADQLLRRLPPFPAATTQLLRLLAKEECETSDLLAIAKSDPMFAAELLRTVNSAQFARQRQVTSLQYAAALLGSDRLRSFAVAVSLRSYLGVTLRKEVLAQVWRHSLATAVCCEILAGSSSSTCGWTKETAYVAGLLHDIGSLSLMTVYPDDYSRILVAAAESNCDLRSLEAVGFGMDHCTAGRWIAGNWKLGPEVEEAALHHHEPFQDDPQRTLELVKAAVLLADSLGWPSVAAEPLPAAEAIALLPTYFQQRINMPAEQLLVCIQEQIEAVSQAHPGDAQRRLR